MSEAICLHIGQAGARIGTAVWERLAIEQGIDTQCASGVQLKETDTNLRTHWHETEKGSYLPRAVFFDLEPDALDQIKANSNLFPRDLLIRGKMQAPPPPRPKLILMFFLKERRVVEGFMKEDTGMFALAFNS